MPLYEVLLLSDDDGEIRLADHGLAVGETAAIGRRPRLVQWESPPDREEAATRFVCVPATHTE